LPSGGARKLRTMPPQMASSSPRLESRWLTVDGLRLHHRESAAPPARAATRELPPLVLVHGLVVSGRYFLPAATLLARDAHVLIPDLPGFGRSQGPRRALDVPELAAHLGAWLTAVGIPPPLLVGHSFGCQVIAELAAGGSVPLAGLVLAAPTVDPARPRFLQQAAAFLANATREPAALAAIIAVDALRAGPWRAIATLRAALRHRIADVLPHVDVPALVLCGERDPLCPNRWAAEAAALLPRGSSKRIRSATHALHYTAPEEFAESILVAAREMPL
jgi:2-hydroxy-6-oxonona-2,4-dienedioate hydrolase